MIDELSKDAEMHREKAGKHGEYVAGLVSINIFANDAVSHARLAASHGRRALELESQISESLKRHK
jgi:hypothetical protein